MTRLIIIAAIILILFVIFWIFFINGESEQAAQKAESGVEKLKEKDSHTTVGESIESAQKHKDALQKKVDESFENAMEAAEEQEP